MMSSSKVFLNPPKSSKDQPSDSSGTDSFHSPIRQSATLVGAASSGSKYVHRQGTSVGLSAVKSYFFSSPSVTPQRHVKETDSITRRGSAPTSKMSIVSFLCGVESDPLTVQLRAPDGCSFLFQFCWTLLLVTALHYVHGKSYFQLLSANTLGFSTLSFLAGVFSRNLLSALPDSRRTGGTVHSGLLPTLVSCATGDINMVVVAIFMLLGRNILVKQCSLAPLCSASSGAVAAPVDPVEEKKGLLYNSGIGTPRSKQRF